MIRNKLILGTSISALALICGIFTSCTDDAILKGAELNLPSTVANYVNYTGLKGEINITNRIKDGSRSTFNDHSATLGRVLFYDTKLSINNTVSCGTCHDQSKAFSDGLALSKGFGNKETDRNSMALLNPVDNNNMFWDSRASSPLDLSLQPVFNHIEMGIETDEMLVEKVSAASYYPELFTNAFGSEEITKERISLAITAFVNSIFSMESKFDQGVVNEFANFTSLEKIGKDLFHSDRLMCTSCHAGDNFSAPDFPGGPYGSSGFRGDDDSGPKGTANIGLDLVHKDAGRADGKFKIPSLRNVALTAPYMHDGRFNTLDEVLDHYSHGIQNHPNLDSKFIENGQTVKLNITEAEKIALIAFLNTFTDENLITDPKFSNPFH